jgi:hypothetical protein
MENNVDWVDFICSGKKPALLEAVRSGTGIIKGKIYRSWQIERGMFRIWNSNQNSVLAQKVYFKVIDIGDAAEV